MFVSHSGDVCSRRPSDPSSQAQDTGFGRRRRPGARPRPATAEPSPVDLLAVKIYKPMRTSDNVYPVSGG